MVAPVFEAILAGLVVGMINRMLARIEHSCPDERRDDSDVSTASSGTQEIPPLL